MEFLILKLTWKTLNRDVVQLWLRIKHQTKHVNNMPDYDSFKPVLNYHLVIN